MIAIKMLRPIIKPLRKAEILMRSRRKVHKLALIQEQGSAFPPETREVYRLYHEELIQLLIAWDSRLTDANEINNLWDRLDEIAKALAQQLVAEVKIIPGLGYKKAETFALIAGSGFQSPSVLASGPLTSQGQLLAIIAPYNISLLYDYWRQALTILDNDPQRLLDIESSLTARPWHPTLTASARSRKMFTKQDILALREWRQHLNG